MLKVTHYLSCMLLVCCVLMTVVLTAMNLPALGLCAAALGVFFGCSAEALSYRLEEYDDLVAAIDTDGDNSYYLEGDNV